MSDDRRQNGSSVIGRLGWAAGMRRRRKPAVWARLAWHDFIVHGLRNRGGERCQECGRGYPLWRAPDNLYALVHGTTAGLLCPACFDRKARAHGLSVEFQAVQLWPERLGGYAQVKS